MTLRGRDKWSSFELPSNNCGLPQNMVQEYNKGVDIDKRLFQQVHRRQTGKKQGNTYVKRQMDKTDYNSLKRQKEENAEKDVKYSPKKLTDLQAIFKILHNVHAVTRNSC